MFPDNNWYGHRYILLKYLKEKDRAIFASLQHGWISRHIKTNYKKKIYPILCWSKLIEKNLKEKNKLKVKPIGSPFLYLCKMLEEKYKLRKVNKKKFEGTIVFPTHSSQDLKHNTNHDLLIKDVEESFNGPYTVCFYYYDLNEEDIKKYKQKKWKVVCCVRGKTDKYSLIRLYREINKNETVVSGEFSTSLFYGMYLKKKTRLYLNSNKRFKDYTHEEKNFVTFYQKKYPELFKSFLPSDEGYNLAKEELGFNSFKEKNELKNILGVNSFLKSMAAKLFARIYDLKYGKELREGKDLPRKKLLKYISAART